MDSQFQLACPLQGELQYLRHVTERLSDHSRKREYASWLRQQHDPRSDFLDLILDEWESGEPFLAVDNSIDLVWQRTCGVTIMQVMRAEKFEQCDRIFEAARPALMINPFLAENEVAIGASKFGGLPDLNRDEPWPEFNGKLHAFLGQINLSEIGETQASTSLPKNGLLSFFVYNQPGDPAASGAEGAWKVVFTSDTSQLGRRDPPKPLLEGCEVAPECTLEFEETLDLPYVSTSELGTDYEDRSTGCLRARELGVTGALSEGYEELLQELMPEREERSHLLGWSHPQVGCDDPLGADFRNLVTIASEEVCGWCWADGHQLYYGVVDEQMKRNKFDQTCITNG